MVKQVNKGTRLFAAMWIILNIALAPLAFSEENASIVSLDKSSEVSNQGLFAALHIIERGEIFKKQHQQMLLVNADENQRTIPSSTNVHTQPFFDRFFSVLMSFFRPTGITILAEDPSLMLYLSFDNNLSDGSLQQNNGLCSGSACPRFVPGKVNSAAEFDGLDDVVRIPRANSLDFQKSNFSVAFWVKNGSIFGSPPNRFIFANGYYDQGPGFGLYGYGFYGTNGSDLHYAGMPKPLMFEGWQTDFRDGNWHHIAYVVERTPAVVVVHAYTDGQRKNTNSYVGNSTEVSLVASRDLLIGSGYAAYVGGIGGFNNMSLDEFRIYNRVISPEEVQELFQYQPSIIICGNNIIESPEECDDGNTVSGDGCSVSCQVETALLNPSFELGSGVDALHWFESPG